MKFSPQEMDSTRESARVSVLKKKLNCLPLKKRLHVRVLIKYF